MMQPLPIDVERIDNKVFKKPEQCFLIEIDHSNGSVFIQRADQTLELYKLDQISMRGTLVLLSEHAGKLLKLQ